MELTERNVDRMRGRHPDMADVRTLGNVRAGDCAEGDANSVYGQFTMIVRPLCRINSRIRTSSNLSKC